MSAAAGAGWSAGAKRIQVAFRDSNGYPMGTLTTPDSPTPDSAYSAHVISGLRSLTHPQKTVAKALDKGDQKVYGQMFLGVDDYGQGTFEVGAEDEVFNAYLNKSVLDTTIASDMVTAAENAGEVDPPPMFLIATTRKQMHGDGSFWYDNHIYNNVLIRNSQKANISQQGGESPNPLQYEFLPSLSDRIITGHLFADTDMEVNEDEDTCIKIRSRYPLAVTTYVADGTEMTFNLPYLPVYSGATGAAQNIVTKNGAPTAVASIATATGLVTLSAAGNSGDIWVVVYQTLFRAA